MSIGGEAVEINAGLTLITERGASFNSSYTTNRPTSSDMFE
jgi:hypothetical protein